MLVKNLFLRRIWKFNQYNLYVKIPKILISSGEVDGVIIYAVFGFEEIMDVVKKSGGKSYEEFDISNQMMKGVYLKPMQRFVRKRNAPILYIGPQGYSNPWVREFIKSDIPIFDLWDMPIKTFSVLARYSDYRTHHL